MKYIFISISLFLIYSLNADEINKKEFPYILPISVERFNVATDYQPISKTEDEKETENKENATPETIKVDSDKDGIYDNKDECPDTSRDFVVDTRGCPLTTTLKVNFQSSKADILPDSQEEIKRFADFLRKNEEYQVIIYGYTDNSGNEASNKRLSQNRAKAVMRALIDNGIKLIRLTAIGMGSKNPIADNATPEGRTKNRRIEVELIQ